MLRPRDLPIPEDWARADSKFAERLADEFNDALAGGLPGTVMQRTIEALGDMFRTLQVIEQGGEFVKSHRPDEVRELQPRVRDCLRAANVKVDEGAKLGGGETDLILLDTIILENKVLDSKDDPFDQLDPAGWQARRYAIALSQKVRFVCAAYEPRTESALLTLPQRVRARPATRDDAVEVQFVIPYGHGIPSKAGRPRPNGLRRVKPPRGDITSQPRTTRLHPRWNFRIS